MFRGCFFVNPKGENFWGVAIRTHEPTKGKPVFLLIGISLCRTPQTIWGVQNTKKVRVSAQKREKTQKSVRERQKVLPHSCFGFLRQKQKNGRLSSAVLLNIFG